MPSLEEYFAHWTNRYGLEIISSSVDVNTGLQILFHLGNEHIVLLKKHNKSDYERFKIQAEMYVKNQIPFAFPKLNSYQIDSTGLTLSGSPAVINVFLELLFNPEASKG